MAEDMSFKKMMASREGAKERGLPAGFQKSQLSNGAKPGWMGRDKDWPMPKTIPEGKTEGDTKGKDIRKNVDESLKRDPHVSMNHIGADKPTSKVTYKRDALEGDKVAGKHPAEDITEQGDEEAEEYVPVGLTSRGKKAKSQIDKSAIAKGSDAKDLSTFYDMADQVSDDTLNEEIDETLDGGRFGYADDDATEDEMKEGIRNGLALTDAELRAVDKFLRILDKKGRGEDAARVLRAKEEYLNSTLPENEARYKFNSVIRDVAANTAFRPGGKASDAADALEANGYDASGTTYALNREAVDAKRAVDNLPKSLRKESGLISRDQYEDAVQNSRLPASNKTSRDASIHTDDGVNVKEDIDERLTSKKASAGEPTFREMMFQKRAKGELLSEDEFLNLIMPKSNPQTKTTQTTLDINDPNSFFATDKYVVGDSANRYDDVNDIGGGEVTIEDVIADDALQDVERYKSRVNSTLSDRSARGSLNKMLPGGSKHKGHRRLKGGYESSASNKNSKYKNIDRTTERRP